MDALTRLALVGTRSDPVDPPTPVDAVIPADGDRERLLLLRAGALASYRRAGHAPARVGIPAPAPEEAWDVCGQRVADAVVAMVDGFHADLLDEVVDRMVTHRKRLPDDVLPKVLDAAGEEARPLVRRVLGERGRWLARFQPGWSWALAEDGVPTLPADADLRFQEAPLDERLALLRAVRALDPARGRGWLEAAWDVEKAPVRARLLSALEVGLVAEDEPFLESARRDRSSAVKDVAVSLLVRLPTSAVAGRVRERADRCVTGSAASLVLEPPIDVDADWAADGLPVDPPQGVGRRAFWLTALLSRVDPVRWEERLGVPPIVVVGRARSSEWAVAALQGLALAAVTFRRPKWAGALWDAWSTVTDAQASGVLQVLVPVLDPADAEARALGALTAGDVARWTALVRVLPTPWRPRLANAFLDSLARHLAQPLALGVDPWLSLIGAAGRGLPRDVFDRAFAPWTPAEGSNPWLAREWQKRLGELQDAIRIRQTLWEDPP